MCHRPGQWPAAACRRPPLPAPAPGIWAGEIANFTSSHLHICTSTFWAAAGKLAKAKIQRGRCKRPMPLCLALTVTTSVFAIWRHMPIGSLADWRLVRIWRRARDRKSAAVGQTATGVHDIHVLRAEEKEEKNQAGLRGYDLRDHVNHELMRCEHLRCSSRPSRISNLYNY